MSDPGENSEIEALIRLSRAILDSFLSVSDSARHELAHHASGTGSLSHPGNPLVHGNTAERQRLASALSSSKADVLRLAEEPFVARTVVRRDGEPRVIYFSRFGTLRRMPPDLDGELASYRSPLGRLAELPPGRIETIRIPRGEVRYEIGEVARVRPVRGADAWDARNNEIVWPERAVTLASLREFLAQTRLELEPEDLLAAIEAEAGRARSAISGYRRRLVERMSLRDQPILDQYQGEVFRRPLNRRLFLVGPPGTGKTTTLIRRLAQKRRYEELSEEERELISSEEAGSIFHDDNWVMFVPTDLLKLYVKEAFSREGVAASDARVRTWSEERRRLSRDVFNILRSQQGGRFILDEDAEVLVEQSSRSLTSLADAFSQFVVDQLSNRYREAVEALSVSPQQEARQTGELLARRLGNGPIDVERILTLVSTQEVLNERRHSFQERVELAVRREINALLTKRPRLLDDLASQLRTLQPDSDDDGDEEIDEDEIDADTGADPRLLAPRALRAGLRSRALAISRGRGVAPDSRAGHVLRWLGQSVPSDEALRPVGFDLEALRNLRFAAAIRRNLVDRIPGMFQRFRRSALRAGTFYRSEGRSAIERWRISVPEVDVILREMLRNTRRFEARGLALSPADQLAIERVLRERVTQVLVDEATDFSPVELACMLELANPRFRSFFLAGDPRQRVTPWGVQDLHELPWIAGDFEVCEVRFGYRQSTALTVLADAVAAIGHLPPTGSVNPPHIDEAPVPPLLIEQIEGPDLAGWLRDRISEIESTLGKVPSIAIFVDGDERIEGLVNDLKPLLRERNIEAVGCVGGRVVGADSQVRVFDVKYIKGLEFEAVFFVGVDEMVHSKPDLFDKFLFLGITRAATYLGMTCAGRLPAPLAPIRSHVRAGTWRSGES